VKTINLAEAAGTLKEAYKEQRRPHPPAIQALKIRSLNSQCFSQLLFVKADDYGIAHQRDWRSHDMQLLQFFQSIRVRNDVSILEPNPIFRKKLFRQLTKHSTGLRKDYYYLSAPVHER